MSIILDFLYIKLIMNIRIKNNTIKCINFVINLLKYRSSEYVIRNIDINNIYEILFESLYIRKMGNEYKALINRIRVMEKSTIYIIL